ncbi:MAG: amidohydrolase family protein [Paracoccaceae bacterium]|nr:amidohydrolase family protein [Paracoccaceae bacterium]
MADIRIINCHIHTFTEQHIPRYYPHPLLWLFKKIPGLVRLLAFLFRLIGQEGLADTLDRLCRFQQEAGARTQADVLGRIMPQYPDNTRFVVLPMQMAGLGHGPVREGLRAQHDELARLAVDPRYQGRVIPFATCDPRLPGAADEVARCIEDLGFRGLKLYPRIGFDPDHPVLMNDVYPLIEARGLPVLSHCSRGGISGKGLVPAVADLYSGPEAYIPVMRAFPDLRVNLAHFGGTHDWQAYTQEGLYPGDPAAGAANWQSMIRHMITSGDWPNLWTDISYTLFRFDDFVPFLRVFLQDARLARRVLFGSDFYMTRQEALSERAVCFRLRVALGEDLFRQIAETNPEIWLGERTG